MDITNRIKVTKIYVEAKKSLNFQTYTSGMELSLEDMTEEEVESTIRLYQAKCRAKCKEQFDMDTRK